MRVAEREVGRRPQACRLERLEHPRLALGGRAPIPLTSSGSATKSWIVCFGLSVSYGSWKMSWTRRR